MSNEKKEMRAGEREGDIDTCYRERIILILWRRAETCRDQTQSPTALNLDLTFIRSFCPKPLTVIHSYSHTLMVLTSTPGAVWGSVSCSRTLRHADQGNWTSNLLMTRRWLNPWSTAITWAQCCPVRGQRKRELSFTLKPQRLKWSTPRPAKTTSVQTCRLLWVQVCFLSPESRLNLDQIWTKDSTYLHRDQ